MKPLPESGKASQNLRLIFLETPEGVVFHGADRLAGKAPPVNPREKPLHDAAVAAALALVVAKARWLVAGKASLTGFTVDRLPRRLLLIAETSDPGNWITTVWTGFAAGTEIKAVFAGATDAWKALIASGGRDRKTRLNEHGRYIKPLRIGLDITAWPIENIRVVRYTQLSSIQEIDSPVALVSLVDEVVAAFTKWQTLKIDLKTGNASVQPKVVRELRRSKDTERVVPVGLPYQADELDTHKEVFGRDWVFERVDGFIKQPANEAGGYLFLVADPYFGKTAIVSELIRRRNELAAYHLIKRGRGDWDDVGVMMQSLVKQIRERYGLSGEEADSSRRAEGLFHDVLRQVSRVLPEGEQALIIIDGLDEAFGLGGRFTNLDLSTAFPNQLPPRCKIILTSRNGEHLDSVRGVPSVAFLNLRDFQKENEDDIHRWLTKESTRHGLGLDESFLRKLTAMTEGCFGVAVWYLRPRPELREELRTWQQRVDAIPSGLERMLSTEWSRLVCSAKRETISEAECRRFLGFVIFNFEPISWSTLQALLLTITELEENRRLDLPPSSEAAKILQPGRLLTIGERILGLAGEFFTRSNGNRSESTIHFFHTSFLDFVFALLIDAGELKAIETLWAEGCSGWRNPRLRKYALAHRLRHLAGVKDSYGLHALRDLAYVNACKEESAVGYRMLREFQEAIDRAYDGRD